MPDPETADSLTVWMVATGGSLLTAAAMAAFKLFDRGTQKAIDHLAKSMEELKTAAKENHDEVVAKVEHVADRVGEHASQLAVLHSQYGQLKQELTDMRTRQDALAVHWQTQWAKVMAAQRKAGT